MIFCLTIISAVALHKLIVENCPALNGVEDMKKKNDEVETVTVVRSLSVEDMKQHNEANAAGVVRSLSFCI